MEKERRFVTQLIQMDVFGGRSVQKDSQTLVLYDVPAWGDTQSHAVRSKFPSCEVSYMTSQSSLSGFIIVIKKHESAQVAAWLLFMCICGAAFVNYAFSVRGWSSVSVI